MSVYCSQGHENTDGSGYCDTCGEQLPAAQPASVATQQPADLATQPASPVPVETGTQVCPHCGTSNPAGEVLCSHCGMSLLPTSAPADANAASAVPQAPAPDLSSTPTEPPAMSSAPTALSARLIVEADNQEFDLSGKDTIVIGREDAVSNIFPDVDLTPHGGEEGGVSRLHARIFVENGQYMLEDENSTNFTFLNRQRLAGKTPTPLHDNDEVKLGRVLLRFKTP